VALVKVGDAIWDLLDEDGRHLQVGAEPNLAVSMPRHWRVFGPFEPDLVEVKVVPGGENSANLKAVPSEDQLSAIPDQLTIANATLVGVNVDMVGNMLDFDALYDGHDGKEGVQAYALAELQVDSDTEIIIGAGCDWWMQWWLDGQPVYDTLDTGNGPYLLEPTDHCFRANLKAGKHVLAVAVISGSGGPWAIRTDTVTARVEAYASRKPGQWNFLTDPEEVHPPATGTQLRKAFRTDLVLTDETLECEYQLAFDNGHVGLVFGAQDSDHYYWAYIPHWGQLWRARAFYAAIAIADGSGYVRNLDLRLMHNVPCHLNIWRSLRVERRGNHIQMWVNGVKGPNAIDDTYGPGRVGVSGFNRWAMRNLRIDGKHMEPPVWPTILSRQHRFAEPFAAEGGYLYHAPVSLNRLSNGEILLITNKSQHPSPHVSDPNLTSWHMYLSADAGRTWSSHGDLSQGRLPSIFGRPFEIEPGILRSFEFISPNPGSSPSKEEFYQGSGFYYRDSKDKAMTWSQWSYGKLEGGWETEMFRENTHCSVMGSTMLRDGTILASLLLSTHRSDSIKNIGMGTWPAYVMLQPYCTISKDQGQSWSLPVPMDNAAMNDGSPPDSPLADFTETPMAQLPSGRVVALSRPVASPFMWQTQSEDGGKSWRQCCYAPFSGSGNPNLVATSSGLLALVARCGGVGIHISDDEGLNWTPGAMLDSSNYFNGLVIEAEPDVILAVYPVIDDMPMHLRTLRVRVTPQGPMPAI